MKKGLLFLSLFSLSAMGAERYVLNCMDGKIRAEIKRTSKGFSLFNHYLGEVNYQWEVLSIEDEVNQISQKGDIGVFFSHDTYDGNTTTIGYGKGEERKKLAINNLYRTNKEIEFRYSSFFETETIIDFTAASNENQLFDCVIKEK